jgi:gliding motility-associated-like protein
MNISLLPKRLNARSLKRNFQSILRTSAVLFAFLFVGNLKATHMMGADISYRCLGGGKYKIIMKVYRDCQGIAFNNPTFGAFAGTNGSNTCGQYTLSSTRTGIRDVTPVCASGTGPCNPQNTGFSGEGVEEHTFEATVDFTKAPLKNFTNNSSCCEVTFYVGQCCRNSKITTGPANNNFFATAMINLCNLKKMEDSCNNSPYLSNEPIGFLCCNQPYYFNNGAIDTVEFDSFSYKLVHGISTLPNTSVNYSSPFTFKYPMTPFCIPPTSITCRPNTKTDPPRGFFMDESSGDIIFTPTKCDEVGIIVIEITEHRQDTTGKWKVIGKTRRDMQLIVKDDCGYNKAPKVKGPANNSVCEGDKICFTIDGTDETFTPNQLIPDTVQMKWNKGIPGATFKILNPTDREKEAEFCWQTKIGQASPVSYSFTVTANDNHCPRPSIAIKGFKVKVKPRAFGIRSYENLSCGRLAFSAKPEAGFKGVATYKWSFRDSMGQNEFYYTTLKEDTLVFTKGGKFIVVHTVSNSDNCPTIYRDTIEVPDPPIAILATADTFACHGDDITMEPLILNAKAPFEYYWTRPDTHVAGDTFAQISLPNVQEDTTLIVRIIDGDGCIFYDTVKINHKPLPVLDLGIDRRICTYESVTFNAGHDDTMYYSWNTLDTTQFITVVDDKDYTVRVTDTIWGCYQDDTVRLYVNDLVIADAGIDQMICTKDSASIIANHSPALFSATYNWTDITGGLPLGTNKSYKVSPKNNNGNGNSAIINYYRLFTRVTQDTHSCVAVDTMAVKINTLPKVKWSTLDPECWVYGDILLNPFILEPKDINNITITTDKTPGIIDENTSGDPTRWTFKTQMLDNEALNKQPHTERLTISYTDTNGCTFTDAVNQVINGNPGVELRDRVYCQDKGEALMDSSILVPKSFTGLKLKWEVLTTPAAVNPMFILEDRGFPAKTWMKFGAPSEDYYSGDYTFKLCVSNSITGCRTCKEDSVHIVPEPKITVNPPSPKCVTSDTMDLLDYFLLNGTRPFPGDGTLSVLQAPFGSTNSTLISGHRFFPGWGRGVWEFKYSNASTGCLKEDSFFLNVIDTPDAILLPNRIMCENEGVLDLTTVLDRANSKGVASSSWSGDYVSGSNFTPTSTKTSAIEGPYTLKLAAANSQGCVDTEYYQIRIRTLPEVSISNTKPGNLCAGDAYGLIADASFDNGVQWSTIQGSDGLFTAQNAENTDYNHGTGDAGNRKAWVKISTLPLATDEVCPQATDSMEIIINPYPVISIDPPIQECAPYIANFTSTESEGINPASLTYRWDFGNGDTSDQVNPTGINYPNQGVYNVGLTVTNTAGNCVTSITENSFVEIYPVPVAAFVTDPLASTTIALPRFQMDNLSTLQTDVFANGAMNYNWKFNDQQNPLGDTSTLKNPWYSYQKDTGYYTIYLLVTSDKGCIDTVSQRVYIGPDIIVFIPDAFSPNGFGPKTNNVFIPVATNFKDFKMVIFNRWGEKMYETESIEEPWDGDYYGKTADQGVYVYYIEVSSLDDKVYKFDGTFHLLR